MKKVFKWLGITLLAGSLIFVLINFYLESSYKEAQESLSRQSYNEKMFAKEYVSLKECELKLKESNLFSEYEYVVRGSVQNSAEFHTLESMLLELCFYSRNDVLIKCQEYAVSSIDCSPSDTRPFTVLITLPDDYQRWSCTIKEAKMKE